ncbi:MAG: MerR family transcriptional regulator [Acidimicrobiia bacterium]|nr:MerR family transcriptional regulator [Acidimicrobiia bacterium]
MPIGEFSEHSGLSAKRLRNYAAEGLLVPAAVDAGSGYRYYSPGQLRDAQLIDTLRAAGMPLADIAAFLRDPSTEHLDAWVTRVEADATRRRAAIECARGLLADEKRQGGQPMTGWTTASRVDIGRVRETNEDAVVSTDRLAIVADGIGGLPGGETASAVAASAMDAAFTERSLDELKAGARAANRIIWETAASTSDLAGMGTTLCAAGLTENGTVVVVNVGDSRAYLARAGSLTRLTHDHTVTAELVERGELTTDEAADHPHRNVLTRAVGIGPDVELDVTEIQVAEGDRLLLCSDGLHRELDDDDIETITAGPERIDVVVDELVGMALSRGGRDNVAVVVAELRA